MEETEKDWLEFVDLWLPGLFGSFFVCFWLFVRLELCALLQVHGGRGSELVVWLRAGLAVALFVAALSLCKSVRQEWRNWNIFWGSLRGRPGGRQIGSAVKELLQWSVALVPCFLPENLASHTCSWLRSRQKSATAWELSTHTSAHQGRWRVSRQSNADSPGVSIEGRCRWEERRRCQMLEANGWRNVENYWEGC